MYFWGLKAVPGSQLLFHAFTASSSQQLHLPRWHVLCCSPASQMLAFRRCPGKQPCSVLHAVEGSTRLSTSVHRECDFADLCPASSLSTSSAVPWPSSTQPPGKDRRHEKLPEDGHRTADSFMALWWHWLSGATSKTECWAVQSPTGRVKANPKWLAVKQLNFGNGFMYKLLFHLRHSQQIRAQWQVCLTQGGMLLIWDLTQTDTHWPVAPAPLPAWLVSPQAQCVCWVTAKH